MKISLARCHLTLLIVQGCDYALKLGLKKPMGLAIFDRTREAVNLLNNFKLSIKNSLDRCEIIRFGSEPLQMPRHITRHYDQYFCYLNLAWIGVRELRRCRPAHALTIMSTCPGPCNSRALDLPFGAR